MQPIEKRFVSAMVGSRSQWEKSSRQNFFVKILFATPMVFLFDQLFYFATLFDMALQKKLVLII